MVNIFAHVCVFGLFLGLTTGLIITDEKCTCPPDAIKDSVYCGFLLSPECFKHRLYLCEDGVATKRVPCIGLPCVTNHTTHGGKIASSMCLPRDERKAYLEGNAR